MDPLFAATPPESEIAAALALWPELAGKRIRPVLVTAFGDIYIETADHDVWVCDPIALSCERVANSVDDLDQLLSDREWAEEHLLAEVALLARDRGKLRPQHQVYAIAPHPAFSGSIKVDQLMPMDLSVWHHIASQLRVG